MTSVRSDAVHEILARSLVAKREPPSLKEARRAAVCGESPQPLENELRGPGRSPRGPRRAQARLIPKDNSALGLDEGGTGLRAGFAREALGREA